MRISEILSENEYKQEVNGWIEISIGEDVNWDLIKKVEQSAEKFDPESDHIRFITAYGDDVPNYVKIKKTSLPFLEKKLNKYLGNILNDWAGKNEYSE